MKSDEIILKALNEEKYNLAADYLKENIREKAAKKQGAKSSDFAILKRIPRTRAKETSDRFSNPHSFQYNGKEFFGFTNFYYILASENDFGYDVAIDHANLNKMFPDDWNDLIPVQVNRGNAVYMKSLNKIEKVNMPVIVDFDEGQAGFNPQYFIDCLDFVDTDTMYVNPNYIVNGVATSPVFFRNANNGRIALLLPVRLVTNKKTA